MSLHAQAERIRQQGGVAMRGLFAVSFMLGMLLGLGSCTGSSSDKNCADFSCQSDAQAWHNSHPGDGLDGDGDGIACEHLPSCVSLPAHEHRSSPGFFPKIDVPSPTVTVILIDDQGNVEVGMLVGQRF